MAIKAITAPPANTDRMMRQLAMPVASRIMAPMRIQSVDVSPNEPGIRPINMSSVDSGSWVKVVSEAASSLCEVAPEVAI